MMAIVVFASYFQVDNQKKFAEDNSEYWFYFLDFSIYQRIIREKHGHTAELLLENSETMYSYIDSTEVKDKIDYYPT